VDPVVGGFQLNGVAMNRRMFLKSIGLAATLAACGKLGLKSNIANGPLQNGQVAPELVGGGAWINSAPLTLSSLRGRPVLVDFWTYGCYNCQNTLPAARQWWQRYQDQGLMIIGVHTPEFPAEHELPNVRNAVQQQSIGWPVVQDNEYAIWRAYGNNYWPHFYLLDHRGVLIYDHIGEGAYDTTERQIVAALAAARA
jgi:thiol-disulfide isomerase/thioredoxin